MLSPLRRPPIPLRASWNSPKLRDPTQVQVRKFLKPADLESLLNTSPPQLRHLTHSRTIPYPPGLTFQAIASIDQYPSFLPFVTSASISARDPANYPTRGVLTVGYEPLGIQERWESVVCCDEGKGVVEARSADGEGEGKGTFEVLKTRWEVKDAATTRNGNGGAEGGSRSDVRLDVQVKFRSTVYDRLFAGVEERVAGMMVGAFEKRIRELAGK